MFVILVLLTAYFQSPRLGLISIGAVPGVLTGIVIILYVTGTTLNIESFMGSIMSIGVSVSNSVMLVTFMNEHWQKARPPIEAAVAGARERLRPILMTACAMTVGMVPMALALEGQPDAGSARPGGHRRTGDVDRRPPCWWCRPIFAIVIGRKEARLAFDVSGRSREQVLRPGLHAEPSQSGEILMLSIGDRRPVHRLAGIARNSRRHGLDYGAAAARGRGRISPAPPSRRPCRWHDPEVRTIVRVVGQPSFVESYERRRSIPR